MLVKREPLADRFQLGQRLDAHVGHFGRQLADLAQAFADLVRRHFGRVVMAGDQAPQLAVA